MSNVQEATMQESNRREFLKSSAAMLAGAPAIAASRLSPNDRIRVALIGLRGRGRDHIQSFHELAGDNVELVTFCDVDQTVMDQRVASYEKLSGKKVQTVTDMRKVFDDKSIDAVGIATPNHWHALATVWACQAGKDVYVEKPGTHCFSEGKKIIDAANKYKRIVQHGTQNRSSPNIVEGIQKLKDGVIGKVYLARGVAFKGPRPNIGMIEGEATPPGLDWDKWQGPAPKKPYSKVIHRWWHQLWDYGNGDLGNQGVHECDIIRWGLGLNTHPTKVASMGGQYIQKDAEQAPQVHSVMYEWAGHDVLVTFETRSGFTNTEAGMGAEYPFLDKKNVVGVIFIGTEGYMIFPDYSSYRTFLGPKRTPGPSNTGAGDIANLPHFANFIKGVRSRKPGDLNAGIQELHLSAALPHFANIAQRTGQMLHFDAKTERFIGNERANALLTQSYRAPYVLPVKV
jgi:predicted dehydrogenase